MFLHFWQIWNTQRHFFGLLMHCGYAKSYGSTKVLILVFMFLKNVILCVYPWCDLLWYNFFFIFQGIVWLVKSSWCVQNCYIHQFYWISDRCSNEFALREFFIRKNCRHSTGSFFLYWSWIPDIPWVFIILKNRASLLGLIMHCILVNASQECLIFGFSFSVESCLFMCLSVMLFSPYKFCHFWSQCLADVIILMCSIFLIIQFYSGSDRCTGKFALERFVSIKLSQIGSFH